MGANSVRHARRHLQFAKCHYCNGPATTFDHIVPRALKGPNRAWNRIPACQRCNQQKGDKYPTCMCTICNNARGLSFLEIQPVRFKANEKLLAIAKAALHTDFQHPRIDVLSTVRDKVREEKVFIKRGLHHLIEGKDTNG